MRSLYRDTLAHVRTCIVVAIAVAAAACSSKPASKTVRVAAASDLDARVRGARQGVRGQDRHRAGVRLRVERPARQADRAGRAVRAVRGREQGLRRPGRARPDAATGDRRAVRARPHRRVDAKGAGARSSSRTSPTRSSRASRSRTRITRRTASAAKQALEKAGLWDAARGEDRARREHPGDDARTRARAASTPRSSRMSLAVVDTTAATSRSTRRCTSRSTRSSSCAAHGEEADARAPARDVHRVAGGPRDHDALRVLARRRQGGFGEVTLHRETIAAQALHAIDADDRRDRAADPPVDDVRARRRATR